MLKDPEEIKSCVVSIDCWISVNAGCISVPVAAYEVLFGAAIAARMATLRAPPSIVLISFLRIM